MISHDPSLRPSAAEVMADLLASKNVVAKKEEAESPLSYQNASDTISHLLLVIESLKKELAEKDAIIEKLKSTTASSYKFHVDDKRYTL